MTVGKNVIDTLDINGMERGNGILFPSVQELSFIKSI